MKLEIFVFLSDDLGCMAELTLALICMAAAGPLVRGDQRLTEALIKS